MAVIYPNTEDDQGCIIARLYDPGNKNWSSPFQLAQTGDYASFYDATFDSSGNFHIAYNNSKMAIIGGGDAAYYIGEGEQADEAGDFGAADLIETNDLCVLKAQPLTNIKTSNVYFNQEDMNPGEKFAVSALIDNIGGVKVNSVVVSVDGKQIGTFNIQGGVAPGETSVVEFEMSIVKLISSDDPRCPINPGTPGWVTEVGYDGTVLVFWKRCAIWGAAPGRDVIEKVVEEPLLLPQPGNAPSCHRSTRRRLQRLRHRQAQTSCPGCSQIARSRQAPAQVPRPTLLCFGFFVKDAEWAHIEKKKCPNSVFINRNLYDKIEL